VHHSEADYFTDRVREFHVKHGAPVNVGVTLAALTLRKSLVYEEASEILLAVHDRDEVEFVDGMADLIYVAAGTWVSVSTMKHPRRFNLNPLKGVHELWDPKFISVIHHRIDKVLESVMKHRYSEAIYHAVALPHELGYDPKAIFDEIHASNMTKTPTKGDIRVRVKGPDYRAPDVTRFLRGR
jgi:predicted HAD superfamily Cof-like phosphohydrolase